MVTDADEKALTRFVYREARLADESSYDEWEALWDDDAIYWVPRGEGEFDPAKHVSHLFDHRQRIATRIRQLKTGYRYSQIPVSPMRRMISNLEFFDGENEGEFEVQYNFILAELAIQSTHEMNFWVGRTTMKVRGNLDAPRLFYKKIALVDGDEPIPSLSFII